MQDPIVIEGLVKDFNGFRAVDSLDLKVQRNSFLGFLGPNGAGKTTTIKILTNLLRTTSGQAFLNGVDVVKSPKEALSCVGAVVETPEFYPYLTPRETLEFLGSLRGMTKEEIKTRTDELLETVKLKEVIDKRIGEFSKGMKQRLAIAQALLHEPSVLILDEPTSGLDPRGMVEVREILKELKKGDYTIFMSSHLLNEVQEICDYVALIDRGKMLAHGSVEDLTHMTQTRRIQVFTLEPVSGSVVEAVSRMNGVGNVLRPTDEMLVVEFSGDPLGQAALLEDIMKLGVRVSQFKEEGLALEALYMNLIKESR
ncbi:MAG TPA: ABC transporter ATP-binding protein [Methanomassiliicoccales archaeon]|nr:ABC transporter ATP-binding protein [Methanomassiliicoccales archaeon]